MLLSTWLKVSKNKSHLQDFGQATPFLPWFGFVRDRNGENQGKNRKQKERASLWKVLGLS